MCIIVIGTFISMQAWPSYGGHAQPAIMHYCGMVCWFNDWSVGWLVATNIGETTPCTLTYTALICTHVHMHRCVKYDSKLEGMSIATGFVEHLPCASWVRCCIEAWKLNHGTITCTETQPNATCHSCTRLRHL